MTRIEMIQMAVDSLKKNKGIDFQLSNFEEYPSGAVDFTCIYPNGKESTWGFPDSWFDPDHNKSDIVKKHYNELQKIENPEARIIAKMAAYFWSIR